MAMTLLVLAAGMGSRYGGLKQIDPMGPCGETLLDFSVYDAMRAGFDRVVFVIRREFEADFRERFSRRYEDRMDVGYAFQDLGDLPGGRAAPPEREKPWGTAHAVWAARGAVDTPFAVINADDFYGADAYRSAAAFFGARPGPGGPPEFAMVGYRLDRTLTEHGSVSRGLCQVDPDGYLVEVVELTAIERRGSEIVDTSGGAAPRPLGGDETVSMNFWAFSPEAFDLIGSGFERFLEVSGGDARAEFYIPAAVSGWIRDGAARLRVLRAEDAWFGVTYREDRESAVGEIAALVAAGKYPSPLWSPAHPA